jgi:hypothetical protein
MTQYTLGDFIEDLKKLDENKLIVLEKGISPTDFLTLSYDISLNISYNNEYDDEIPIKVGELLEKINNIFHKTLISKDSNKEILVNEKMPIYVDNYDYKSGFKHEKYEVPEGIFAGDDTNYYTVRVVGIENNVSYYKLKLAIVGI